MQSQEALEVEEGGRRFRVKDVRRTRAATAGFEDGGREHEPRNTGGLQETEKAKTQILPKRLQRGCSPAV